MPERKGEGGSSGVALVLLLVLFVLVAGGIAAMVLFSQPGGPFASGQVPAGAEASSATAGATGAAGGTGTTGATGAAPATGAAGTEGADAVGDGRISRMISSGEIRSIRLIGDSITAGFLCDGFDVYPDADVVVYSGAQGTYQETAPEVACWANDFRAYAARRGVGSFVNAGVSGFRMEFLAAEPDAWLGEGADLVVVMLGTNDACHASVEEFASYAETALAAAAEKSKELVVVCPPDNARTDASPRYGMDEIAGVLQRISSERGYTCVSLLDALVVGSADFNEDQVHPTSAGSHKLWESLKARLDL